MTREEAAEEVLQGALTPCWSCDGTGVETGSEKSAFGPDQCGTCWGRGQLKRSEHLLALETLEMPVGDWLLGFRETIEALPDHWKDWRLDP